MRYTCSFFDRDTYQVVDNKTNLEVCVCSNYTDGNGVEHNDAHARADLIAMALNSWEEE